MGCPSSPATGIWAKKNSGAPFGLPSARARSRLALPLCLPLAPNFRSFGRRAQPSSPAAAANSCTSTELSSPFDHLSRRRVYIAPPWSGTADPLPACCVGSSPKRRLRLDAYATLESGPRLELAASRLELAASLLEPPASWLELAASWLQLAAASAAAPTRCLRVNFLGAIAAPCCLSQHKLTQTLIFEMVSLSSIERCVCLCVGVSDCLNVPLCICVCICACEHEQILVYVWVQGVR